MGNRASFMLLDEEIKLISEETGFSATQIETLYSRFKSLDSSTSGSLSRQDFLKVPELAINPLCERIVHMFFVDCDEDHDRINFRQFMKVLATFRASHKSSPTSRSRNISRQESLSQQQQQSILKQAPLLFDTIDPSPFSSALTRHSRHSSYHDGFHEHHNNHHHHHTTNQHSVHYAASSTHLPLPLNGHLQHNHHHQHHLFNNHHNHHNSNGLHNHNGNHNGAMNNLNNNNGLTKKLVQLPLVDSDEPANSRKNKLYFMFKIYDTNNDDLLDRDDLVSILKMMVGTYVDDATVLRIADRSLREADTNCDGLIDFEEFCSAFTRKDIDDSLKVKFPHS